MKLILAAALLTLLALAAAGQSLRQTWERKYQQIEATFARRNMKPFIAMLDPHYFIIEKSGKRVDYSAFIKNECDPVAAAKWFKVKATVLSVKSNADGDDVTVEYKWIFSMPDPDAKDTYIVYGRETGTDYWHKSGGKWFMTKTLVKTGSYPRKHV